MVFRFAQKVWHLFLLMALYMLTDLQVTACVMAAYLNMPSVEMPNLGCSLPVMSYCGALFRVRSCLPRASAFPGLFILAAIVRCQPLLIAAEQVVPVLSGFFG